MGFRWRLFLGLAIAVALAALLQGIFGYIAFTRSLDTQLRFEVHHYAYLAQHALRLNQGKPRLRSEPLPGLRQGRFELEKGGKVLLSNGLPIPGSGWLTLNRNLPGGYLLRVAISRAPRAEALGAYIQTNLIALPITLLIVLFGAALMLQFLFRPVRELTGAVRQLSQAKMPEPVRVPSGNDELAVLASSFNHMAGELLKRMERERTFTRYASHELRTPLASFKIQLEALDLGLLPQEQVVASLERSAEQMERILSGLLQLTRSPELALERLSALSLLKSAASAASAGERLRLVCSGCQAAVLGQADLIGQALGNLIENALRYSEGAVDLGAELRGDQVALSVRDYGEGVPEEQLVRLSEPFFRLAKDRKGLGLGLALSAHIANSLGGALEFRNASPGLQATLLIPGVLERGPARPVLS